MSASDRFLYKLFILTFLLLGLMGLNKLEIISFQAIQSHLSQNINTIKIISVLNGKVGLIDLGNEEMTVMNNVVATETIKEGKKVILGEFNGVENRFLGSVIKIQKNNNLYDIYIQGSNGLTYCYSSLVSADVGMYEIVKAGTIIGQANFSQDYYYNFYIFDGNKIVNQ